MANKKIPDGTPIAAIVDATLFEVSEATAIFYKGTAAQIRTNSDLGITGNRTINGGKAASNDLILDSTSDATKGEVQIADGTILHVNTAAYESAISDDNDVPNKKYVDDAVAVESIWDRTGTTVTLQNAGDDVELDTTGGLQFGPAGQNVVEFSIDGTLAGDSDTAIPTEKATKTYVDNHEANGVWTRTGTDIDPTNAGDTVRIDSTGGLQFGAGGQNIVEFSTDGTLAGDSDTAVPTEQATKTYVDNHVSNGMWKRTGTFISVTNADDTLDLATADGIFLSESGIIDVVAVTGIPSVDSDIVYVRSSTAGEITITAIPQIATPTKARRVTFIGMDNTKTVTFVNGNGLATDNGQPFTLGLNDMIVFVYSTTNSIWIEEARKDNS